MIVLCVGMYRSCSTWQYGVASLILERHRGGRRLGFIDGVRFTETAVADGASDGWQTMKAHDAHPCFDEILHGGRALAIYAHRDLRDVSQSWMHMTNASFEEITEEGFLDLCLANDRFWRTRPGVLVQTYEAIVAEPTAAVAQIAAHLGVKLGRDEAQTIADAMSREANRKRIEKLNDRLRSEGNELLPQDLSLFDPNSLLHWNHIRDGRTGAWREEFSPDQCRTLARICGPWLIGQGYEKDLAWAGIVEPEAPVESELPRISYAANAEDILLDRLFRGRAGSYLDIGAAHPTRDNRSYFFYLRGWRGLNIIPTGEGHEAFWADRPDDLNLAAVLADVEPEPEYDEVALPPLPTRTVAGLVEQYRLAVPDIVAIDLDGDVAPVLRGIPLAAWQPKVFVIASDTTAMPDWAAILADRGYRYATTDGMNRYFLRADLKAELPLLRLPVNARDRYERADAARLREEVARLEALREADRAALAELARLFDDNVGGLTGERDIARAEANRLDEAFASLSRQFAEAVEGLTGERDIARAEATRMGEAFASLSSQFEAAVGGLSGERDIARAETGQLAGEVGRLRADLAGTHHALAEMEAGRLADRAAHEAESGRFARETAEAEAAIARLVAERDDLRSDCATWEAEATRQARIAIEGRAALRRAEADLNAERARHAAERERFDRERGRFEQERERFEQEAAGWSDERARREHQLAGFREELRPYRMIDRLGVVGAVHQKARKLGRANPK